ncbi:MAG: hypothetical protein R8G66_12995 [Cytophagales bacterium]|nr:hypothetical protein [Cytophagales bacterium]
MIITNDFVLLNNPKTGSTYCRKIIKQLYKDMPRWKVHLGLTLDEKYFLELKSPNLSFPDRPKNQHGRFSQIPKKYQNIKVVSVVRNPYDKLISAYEYKYHLKRRPSPEILEKARISDLEKISIDQFVLINSISIEMQYPSLQGKEVGSQTIRFMEMFFKKPEEAISKICTEYFESRAYKSDMAVTTFFDQRNLKSDLFSFLRSVGNYDEEQLILLENTPAINKNKNRTPSEQFVWSDYSKSSVQYGERFLFLMLKDMGFNYDSI